MIFFLKKLWAVLLPDPNKQALLSLAILILSKITLIIKKSSYRWNYLDGKIISKAWKQKPSRKTNLYSKKNLLKITYTIYLRKTPYLPYHHFT